MSLEFPVAEEWSESLNLDQGDHSLHIQPHTASSDRNFCEPKPQKGNVLEDLHEPHNMNYRHKLRAHSSPCT